LALVVFVVALAEGFFALYAEVAEGMGNSVEW
jgi:hypothetical protein